MDDHGTYVSVAERLLAGDRLYVDVWDNKDPFFYYVLALGRLVSPLSDYAVEVLWVLIACASTWFLSRATGAGRRRALLLSGLVPLVLTGTAYVPGMTHLPGVALSLAAIAAGARRRWVLGGALIGLLVLTKLVMTPIAVVGMVVCLWHHRSRSGALRVVVAMSVAVGAGAVLLASRGELSGWIDNFRANVVYSDGEIFSSRYGGPVGHLLRAFPEGLPRTALVTVVALVAVLLATWPVVRDDRAGRRTVESRTDLPASVSWTLVVSTLVAAGLVLAVTATWPHHGEALGVPAVLALVLVGATSQQVTPPTRAVTSPRSGPVRGLALLAVTAYALGGALHPTFYLQSARGLPDTVRALEEVPPTTALVAGSPITTYARAGSNDTTAHAVGLGDVRLACPRFHQYPIEPATILDLTAACLPRADAIIVDESVRPEAGEPAWNAYVARVRTLVATGYDCVPTTGSEVCFRRAG